VEIIQVEHHPIDSRDFSFHFERRRHPIVFGVREVLVNGQVIVHAAESRAAVEHIAFVRGLLNQTLHDSAIQVTIGPMKTMLLLGALLAVPSAAVAQTPDAPQTEPLTGSTARADRFQDFVNRSILSPGPYLLAAGAAVLDEVGTFPEEWKGGSGFAKRNVARVGFGFASDAIGHSVAAVLHHRVPYEPCACAGVGSRTTHALSRGFLTRTDNGRVTPHVSLFVAKFGSAGLANTWYPKSYTRSDVVREGVFGIAANALLNIAREYSPELMRLVPFR
jgi:hypothetical protein